VTLGWLYRPKREENSSYVSFVDEKCTSNVKRNSFGVERKYNIDIWLHVERDRQWTQGLVTKKKDMQEKTRAGKKSER